LRSEILDKDFKLWISMKTRKCIMKAGSLDNYLLNTKPKLIGSRFGLHLRDLIEQKLEDPENFDLKYIPGTAKAKRSRKTRFWEYKRLPTMYCPAHLKATTDFSEFYEKAPAEMSRYELQELGEILRLEEEEELEEEQEGPN